MPKECAIYTHVVKKVTHVHNFLTICKRYTRRTTLPDGMNYCFINFSID